VRDVGDNASPLHVAAANGNLDTVPMARVITSSRPSQRATSNSLCTTRSRHPIQAAAPTTRSWNG
jgi:hypothetical protein